MTDCSAEEAYAAVKAWAGTEDLKGDAGPYLDGYNIARQHAREILRSMDDYDKPACKLCAGTGLDAYRFEDIAPYEGYVDAFYKLSALMGIGAQSASPETVWREQMLPRLQLAFAPRVASHGAAPICPRPFA